MALIYNGTTIDTLKYGSTTIDTCKYNNIEVFTSGPAYQKHLSKSEVTESEFINDICVPEMFNNNMQEYFLNKYITSSRKYSNNTYPYRWKILYWFQAQLYDNNNNADYKKTYGYVLYGDRGIYEGINNLVNNVSYTNTTPTNASASDKYARIGAQLCYGTSPFHTAFESYCEGMFVNLFKGRRLKSYYQESTYNSSQIISLINYNGAMMFKFRPIGILDVCQPFNTQTNYYSIRKNISRSYQGTGQYSITNIACRPALYDNVSGSTYNTIKNVVGTIIPSYYIENKISITYKPLGENKQKSNQSFILLNKQYSYNSANLNQYAFSISSTETTYMPNSNNTTFTANAYNVNMNTTAPILLVCMEPTNNIRGGF